PRDSPIPFVRRRWLSLVLPFGLLWASVVPSCASTGRTGTEVLAGFNDGPSGRRHGDLVFAAAADRPDARQQPALDHALAGVARGQVETPMGGLIVAAVCLTAVVLARQITSLAENTRLLVRTRSLAEELGQNEARFRSLVQNASDVIIVTDVTGDILYESPGVDRVLGYRPEDRVGTNALATIHPDEAAR